jgi:hypothetical protein
MRWLGAMANGHGLALAASTALIVLAPPTIASATVHTGGIAFAEPTNPPRIGAPLPPLVEREEFDHTVSATYDDQAGTLTVRTEVFDPARWGERHRRTEITLGPRCYQGREPDRLYGVWEAGESNVRGEVNLEGFAGQVYGTGSFDGQAFTVTFQSPYFTGKEWRCFTMTYAGEDLTPSERNEQSFSLSGYPSQSQPAPAKGSAHVLAPRSYKPTHHWCPTNRTCFSRVTWTTYTGTRAVGHGPARECAGGGGHCRSYNRLTVVLNAPRRVCGALRFTQLRLFGRTFRLNTLGCSTYQP